MSEESRTKKSIKNIFGGALFKVTGMLFPFIIKVVMINTLGVEYLGLNSLFTSILMVLSLSELGVGSALVFNMYKPIAEGDDERVCALLKVYRNFYYIIGSVILVIGIILLPFLKYLVHGSCPSDVNLYILYLIYLINTVLTYFLFAYKKSLWEANQRNGIDNTLASIVSVFMYVLQIIMLLLTRNYYMYIIVMPLCTIVQNLVRNYLVNKMYPQYRPRGELEKGFIKQLFIKIRALLGHKIGTIVITAADSIVISAFLGLSVLAVYGNYYQILNALIGLVSVIYLSITASVGNSIITTKDKNVYDNFSTLSFLNNWLVGWISVCLLCLYQPFMKIWMGEKLMFPTHIMVLFVVYFYSWLARRIGLTYKDAAGMWEQDFWKPYVGAVVNIIVNIILCIYIGVEGVLISTIIVMVLIYFPWETRVLFKHLFKKSEKSYLLHMFYYLLITVVGAMCTYYICSFVKMDGVVALVIKALICLIIPNIIYLLAYFKLSEFKDSKKRIMTIVNNRLRRT